MFTTECTVVLYYIHYSILYYIIVQVQYCTVQYWVVRYRKAVPKLTCSISQHHSAVQDMICVQYNRYIWVCIQYSIPCISVLYSISHCIHTVQHIHVPVEHGILYKYYNICTDYS